MNKLSWCLEQSKGIRLVEPNENVSENYINRAEKDLQNIENQNNIWKVIVSYYACYNALYSVLMRYGLKCEIHDCSIALMSLFEHLKGLEDFMKELKDKRINTQYYLKEPEPVAVIKIKHFLKLCKLELSEVNTNKIEKVRSFLRKRRF